VSKNVSCQWLATASKIGERKKIKCGGNKVNNQKAHKKKKDSRLFLPPLTRSTSTTHLQHATQQKSTHIGKSPLLVQQLPARLNKPKPENMGICALKEAVVSD